MVVNRKVSGTAASMPGGLVLGAVVSLGVTILMSSLLAKMINDGMMKAENIGYGIMVLLLAASFTGALTACSRIKRRRMLVCGLEGLIYFGILLSITALFFGGQYSGVGVTALLIMAGSFCAALLGLRQGRGVKGRKPRRRNR